MAVARRGQRQWQHRDGNGGGMERVVACRWGPWVRWVLSCVGVCWGSAVSCIIMASFLHFKCTQLIALDSQPPPALNSPSYINSNSFHSRSKIIAIITFIDHGTSYYISHCFILNIFIWVHRQLPQTTIVSSYETIEEQFHSFEEQSPSSLKLLSANASLQN